MPVNYALYTKSVSSHTHRHKKVFLFDIDCTLYPPANKLTHNIITGIVKYHNAICPQKEFLGTLYYNKYGHTLKGYLKEVEGATLQQWVDIYESGLSIAECLDRDEELIKMINELSVLKISCDEKDADNVLDAYDEILNEEYDDVEIININKNVDLTINSNKVNKINIGKCLEVFDNKRGVSAINLAINTSDSKIKTEKCNLDNDTNFYVSTTGLISGNQEIIMSDINVENNIRDKNENNCVHNRNIEINYEINNNCKKNSSREKLNDNARMENKICGCEIDEKIPINVSKSNSNAIKCNLLKKNYNKEIKIKKCGDNDINNPLGSIDEYVNDIGMYAFTNASLSVAQKQLDALGIKLDGILYCEYTDDGNFACKPDEEIYDYVEKLFGLKEKDIFLFEDREINLTPGVKRNWNTFFISEENDIKKQLELILLDLKK